MITVVSGLPRSGTSLVMQMLEAGGMPPLIDSPTTGTHRPADASNPRGYYELDAVRRLRKEAPWIMDADGYAVKVIAPLLHFLPKGPDYRVVFVHRDMEEVLSSQAVMLERLGRPVGDSVLLGQAFQKQLESAHALLVRESRFSSLYAEHADLIGCPTDAARAIAAFIAAAGVRLNVDAMIDVVDPALYRARHPI